MILYLDCSNRLLFAFSRQRLDIVLVADRPISRNIGHRSVPVTGQSGYASTPSALHEDRDGVAIGPMADIDPPLRSPPELRLF